REFASEREKLDVKQMIEQERMEAERLHNLDLLKIKFLTDLSHEFRTPISLITAPVEELLEKQLPESISEHLQMIRRNCRRLLNLVNQLLDFRKMEVQGLQLEAQPGDVVSFVTKTAESFKDLAANKQIVLNVEHEGNGWYALFDHDKLERILFNLLSNAFKFTPDGGAVTIKTEIVSNSLQQPVLMLTVSDTGVGVCTEDLERIFERFYQSAQHSSVLNQGTGIGLSITKEFIELHGGSLRAERLPIQGMKFLVELPLIPVENENDQLVIADRPEQLYPVQEKTSASPDAALIGEKATTVLIVEDNDEFRHYIAKNLSQFYNIIEACDGTEGWQKTLSAHPQLVVSDISMPRMNGIDLSKKIKSDKRTRHIPVILLTAATGEQNQLTGLKSGANDYLTKPFNFRILNARIENLLQLNKNLKETYSKQIHLVGQEVKTESADIKLLDTVMKYIDDKLSDSDLSVEDLCKHVSMSRGSLYYKLIELTGLPPVEYIRSVKLEKAAILLENSDYNVAQIAYVTGFGTPSYFTRMFKAKYGMVPSEYINIKRNQAKAKMTDIELLA
ncbi:MAG: response regulator, partial [Mucilaginibacter sp.]